MAEGLLEATVRLTSAMEALAALAAHVRIQTEGIAVDPEIAASLATVAEHLLGDAHIAASDPAPQAIGMTRALLRESIALVEDPTRTGSWSTPDPAVIQGVGRLSMAIAPVIATAAGQLAGLAAALAEPGSRILDVGTGSGWLAIALARTFPSANVVGIDVYEPALELARVNIAAEDLADRISLVSSDVTDFVSDEPFDAVWLPLPFLPRAIVPAAIRQAASLLRSGGWLLPGTFAGPGDELSRLLTDLRIRRSGGHPWPAEEIVTMVAAAGLTDVVEVPRSWPAPLRLYAGRTI